MKLVLPGLVLILGLALFGCTQEEAKAEIKGEIKTANVEPGAKTGPPPEPDGKDSELEAIYGK
ncbi:MAG: hypothetical protein KF884_06765 [Fimbriimonadaceae bacterium]|nr:hypothetical protein [Fimbriimonadaceae bacterium]QYK57252.1 MAG: hypothetical protein KF884_06765 [Fimbriimonadaceae bacterium]